MTSEVLLEPFYPVRGVYHRLDLRNIVQIGEEECDVFVIGQGLDTAIVLAPSQAHVLPGLDALVNRIVLVTGAEHLAHVLRKGLLVAMSHTGHHVTLEMRRAALESRPGELLTDDGVQTGETVSDHQANTLNSTVTQVEEHLAPARRALQGIVIDAQDITGAVLINP